MAIEAGGKTLETDEEGYLTNLADWSEDVANAIAKAENVEMTPNHWEVVNFLREYYTEYQIAPAVLYNVFPVAQAGGLLPPAQREKHHDQEKAGDAQPHQPESGAL